jgi:hypothetical protein
MATLVDALGVLKGFGVYDTIIPFLLVMAGTYAVLVKYKPFGEHQTANGVIAAVVGLVFISFAKAVSFINMLIPMMTIFLIMVVLAVLIFTFVGIKTETMAKLFEKPEGAMILIFIFILIFVITYATVFPEIYIYMQNPVLAQQLNMTPASAGGGAAAPWFIFFQVGQIILSPQIMGLVAMMLVFAIAAFFITREDAT